MATRKKQQQHEEEVSVEGKLKLLYQLQAIMSEIDRISTLRGELPLEVEDLEDEIEGLKTRIGKMEDDILSVRGSINDFKTKYELATSKINIYKEQLDRVRNNREYDTLNKEIEYQTLEAELCKKRIGELITQEKLKEEQVQTNKELLKSREEDLFHKKDELDAIIEETKQDEDKLTEKANDLELQIEPRLLASFKRIRKSSHNGLGVVYVNRDACGSCFSKIPPQKQLDVRMRKKVIVCEYCGRILVDPELAGVKVEEKKETKRKRTSTRKTTKK